ncbi:endothelin-converting enzyme homolog [Haemaphysalis longicornis]
MTVPRPFVVLLLGVVFAGCKFLVNKATLAAYPWCDHPTRCYDYAQELAASVDSATDPCDNLYQHVCDNWDRNHPMLMNGSGQFTLLQFRVTSFVLGALKKPPPQSSPASVKKAVLAYQECIKVLDDERNDVKVLLDVFKKYNLDWPTLTLPDNFDVLDFLLGMSLEYGLQTPFSLSLVPYIKTDRRYGLMLSMNSLVDTIKEPKTIETCISVVAPTARRQVVSDVAQRTIDGYQEFIAMFLALYPGQRITLQLRTLQELANGTGKYAELEDWLRVVNKHLPEDRKIDEDEQVLAYNGSEVALREMFRRSKASRHVTLVLYSAWILIVELHAGFSHELIECLPPDLPAQFKSATSCLQLANRIAPYAIGRFLWDSLELTEAINSTVTVWAGLRNATLQYFKDVHWMDAETAKGAVEHVSHLVSVIGQPEHLKLTTALDEHYNHLPDFKPPFIESWLNASKRHVDKYKRLLKEPPNVTVHREDFNFGMGMTTVNAFYMPVIHVMVIITAIMMPPFVPTDAPRAVHYGAVGTILGHELTHSFDPLFSNLSRTGELTTWYQPESMKKFESRLKCVLEQSADITGSEIRAKNALSETFADTAGAEKARLAYATLAQKKGLLSYTPEQAFYVASCFEFCAADPYASHSPLYLPVALRCNVPVMNQPEFAGAFKCSGSATMNPSEHCTFHAP